MANPGDVVEILLPVALERTYSYRVPFGIVLMPGDVVRVTLGPREVVGVVWDGDGVLPASSNRLKYVEERLALPPVSDHMRRFIEWVANWTLTPRGMIMRMALRAPELPPEKPRLGYRYKHEPERITPARRRVLAHLADGFVHEKRALIEATGVSPGVIDGLVDAGAVEPVALPPEPPALMPDLDFSAASLNEAQALAATSLQQAVSARRFSATLLEGVTGSGKTEVYFEAVAEAVRQGGQALIMLPEIALTNQFLDRFAQRFGVRPAEWHSGVNPGKRARLWHGIAKGEVAVVAGARSALFLPFADLRLIIVDEEHDSAYKQEDGPRYNARDMAVVRARLVDAPAVLASATPSIESRVNADRGRYGHITLPERFGGRALPAISAIDMRTGGPERGKFIAPGLATAVRQALEAGEQALLFLNRRGYAPLTLCRKCGHRFQCPNCTAWLVEHRFRKSLVCHHCGHTAPVPRHCPSCEGEDTLTPCGPGVERIAEEVAGLFPDAHTVILSSDIHGSAERLKQELDTVAKGEANLVIGTQLVAKGHNFPHLTLVGVVDADLGLGTGDPRAAERTFQLLGQVTGRAGRGDRPGRALLQSYDPGHPVMQALMSGDKESFYTREIAIRAKAGLPPYGRMAALTISDEDRGKAESFARALVKVAPFDAALRVLGPAEAPIAVIRGRHRMRLILQAPREFALQDYIRAWLAAGPKANGQLTVEVDIDPMSFA
ncbi:primosomal protein N' [Labrys miyagiensis]|uniref:Replication restart protein PriA n=1 Tax=Labrys miyagiensis TaxID=346912 RepID=A0ABQ6CC79_9HYPH|nr:primosomal protein N' [Labrys miyagiensis]GLS17866.1 primosomal protein N' [Labrys miyagiensis]